MSSRHKWCTLRREPWVFASNLAKVDFPDAGKPHSSSKRHDAYTQSSSKHDMFRMIFEREFSHHSREDICQVPLKSIVQKLVLRRFFHQIDGIPAKKLKIIEFSIFDLSSFLKLFQVMLQLRNPSHLAYLSRNLLKCPRVVRQSITRQRLPVYAQPAVSTNYHQFLERMFVLLYGLECDAEHDPKQWADQIKAEYFSLFRARGYDPGMNDIRVPLLPRVLASLQLSDSDVFVDLGCSTGRLAMAARLLPLCAFDDDDDNHDDVTSSAANTTTSTASARFACARHVFGVELSPTRVAEAQKAVARFQSIRQQQRAGIQTLLAVASSASSSSSSSSSEAAATTSIELERSAENISFICGDIVDSTVLPLGSGVSVHV